jgi:hypothetical protein
MAQAMSDPKPIIVIMDEPVPTWSPTTVDHVDYDGFGEITSPEQLSRADRYEYVGREYDRADLTYFRGHCPCGGTAPRGVWLREDGSIVPAGDPVEQPFTADPRP